MPTAVPTAIAEIVAHRPSPKVSPTQPKATAPRPTEPPMKMTKNVVGVEVRSPSGMRSTPLRSKPEGSKPGRRGWQARPSQVRHRGAGRPRRGVPGPPVTVQGLHPLLRVLPDSVRSPVLGRSSDGGRNSRPCSSRSVVQARTLSGDRWRPVRQGDHRRGDVAVVDADVALPRPGHRQVRAAPGQRGHGGDGGGAGVVQRRRSGGSPIPSPGARSCRAPGRTGRAAAACGPGRSRFAAVSHISTWSPGCTATSPTVNGSRANRLACGNGVPSRSASSTAAPGLRRVGHPRATGRARGRGRRSAWPSSRSPPR